MSYVLAEPESAGVETAPGTQPSFRNIAPDEPGGPQATDAELLEQLEPWVLSQYPADEQDLARRMLQQHSGELLEVLRQAHTESSPEVLNHLYEFHEDFHDDLLDHAPPRRALEAALSFQEAIPEAEGKERFAHLSWSELRERVAEHDLLFAAAGAEDEFVRQQADTGSGFIRDFQLPSQVTEWLASKNGQAKVGPGRRSGNLEDYTRKELSEMLGYQADEAKLLSDADLRNMALEEGVVPPMAGMPSHVDLAWQVAAKRGQFWRSDRTLKDFQRFLREPYVDLADKAGVGTGPGDKMSRETIARQLAENHPFFTAGPANYKRSSLAVPIDRKLYGEGNELEERHGIKTRWTEEDVNQPDPDGREGYVSPIELMYGEQLHGFVEEQGGGYFTGIYGHGGAGRGWSQATHSEGRRRMGAGVLGYYTPRTGAIHLNPALETKLRKARRGKATDQEVAESCSTIAHELLHACSGDLDERMKERRKLGSVGSIPHTIEEGTVSTLEAWHADRLARKMGVWKKEEHLPVSVHYDHQRQVMGALASLATGTFDAQEVKFGLLGDPLSLSKEAVEAMGEAHRTQGSGAHKYYIAKISERYGISEKRATKIVSDMFQTVPRKTDRGRSIVTRESMSRACERLAELGQMAVDGK